MEALNGAHHAHGPKEVQLHMDERGSPQASMMTAEWDSHQNGERRRGGTCNAASCGTVQPCRAMQGHN